MPTAAVLGRSTQKTLAAAVVAVGLVSTPALASGPSFTLIQPADGCVRSYASSVADDGTVAGQSESASYAWDATSPNYTWTEAGGRVDFVPPSSFGRGYPILTPDARSMAMSAVWTVYNSDTGRYRTGSFAYRRNSDGTYTSMPGLPPDTQHRPTGISGDGQRVVGYSGVQGYNNSWLWDNGTTTLITIPGQPDFYTVRGISRDGSTIVGNRGFGYSFGFVRRANGSYETLPGLSPGNQTRAEAVNSDGTIIVGGDSVRPLVWRNMVPTRLGLLADFTHAYATGVSDDGNLIVGIIADSQTLPSQGFVWTPTTGMLTGADFARSIGLEIPMTWVFNQLHVSGNGIFICGVVSATDLSVQSRAFRLQIPSPGAIGLFAGVLALPRRRR